MTLTYEETAVGYALIFGGVVNNIYSTRMFSSALRADNNATINLLQHFDPDQIKWDSVRANIDTFMYYEDTFDENGTEGSNLIVQFSNKDGKETILSVSLRSVGETITDLTDMSEVFDLPEIVDIAKQRIPSEDATPAEAGRTEFIEYTTDSIAIQTYSVAKDGESAATFYPSFKSPRVSYVGFERFLKV